MSRLFAVVLAAAFAGCSTPSIHPLASDDKRISDPALVGTWTPVEGGDKATYIVAADGDRYSLHVIGAEESKPTWDFEMRLFQLGKSRFADVQAPEKARNEIDEKWGPLFIPAHLFCRYAVDGDNLKVWVLDNDWLSKQAAKPTHTRIGHDWTLLTADTKALQSFLESHADEAGAFDVNELKRVKR